MAVNYYSIKERVNLIRIIIYLYRNILLFRI